MLNKLREIREKNEGFTIIEVVIVLAIAGMIFAIVFVAVPQLQASQRDTQRRSDVGRLAAGVTQWAGNHDGDLPSAGSSGEFADADEVGDWNDDGVGLVEDVDQYTLVHTGVPDTDEILYQTGGDCDGSGGVRAFSLSIGLEDADGSSTSAVYCVDG